MYSSLYNRSPTLKWAVLVGISVFVAFAASVRVPTYRYAATVALAYDIAPAAGEFGEWSSGPVQVVQECTNVESCPSCGDLSFLTPCCAKDTTGGKSHCSCYLSSSGGCPKVITASTATVSNGNKKVGPLDDLVDGQMEGDSYTVALQYPDDAFTVTNPVGYSLQGDSVQLFVIANAPEGSADSLVVVHSLEVKGVAKKIAKDYLKMLGSEEITQLLDKEIVQQIAERYSSEILDKKVMKVD